MSARRWLIWRRLRRLYQGFRHPATPWWARGLVILVLLYGISPADLVPDLVPLVGWLDDATQSGLAEDDEKQDGVNPDTVVFKQLFQMHVNVQDKVDCKEDQIHFSILMM